MGRGCDALQVSYYLSGFTILLEYTLNNVPWHSHVSYESLPMIFRIQPTSPTQAFPRPEDIHHCHTPHQRPPHTASANVNLLVQIYVIRPTTYMKISLQTWERINESSRSCTTVPYHIPSRLQYIASQRVYGLSMQKLAQLVGYGSRVVLMLLLRVIITSRSFDKLCTNNYCTIPVPVLPYRSISIT